MKKNRKTLLILLALAITSTLSVFGFYFFHFNGPLLISHDKFAQFGDFIGGTLGPIINLFAFIGLIITIYFQSKSIDLQADALSKQIESTNKIQHQNTEIFYLSSLYNLFSSTNSLIESLTHQIDHDNEVTSKGGHSHLEGNTERLQQRETLIKRAKEIYEEIEKEIEKQKGK